MLLKEMNKWNATEFLLQQLHNIVEKSIDRPKSSFGFHFFFE